MQIDEELLKGGFLLGRAIEDKQHAMEHHAGRGGATIEFRACEGMSIAAQRGQLVFIDGLGDADARSRQGLRRRLLSESEKRSGEREDE